jgi:hypothetical protein
LTNNSASRAGSPIPKKCRFTQGARPEKGKLKAIAESPTATGPVDYVHFVVLTQMVLVKVKRKNFDVAASLNQGKRYGCGFLPSDETLPHGRRWGASGEFRLPSLFPPVASPTSASWPPSWPWELCHAPTEEARSLVRDQFVAKLHLKKRHLSESAARDLETRAGMPPDAFIVGLRRMPLADVAAWITAHSGSVKYWTARAMCHPRPSSIPTTRTNIGPTRI